MCGRGMLISVYNGSVAASFCRVIGGGEGAVESWVGEGMVLLFAWDIVLSRSAEGFAFWGFVAFRVFCGL